MFEDLDEVANRNCKLTITPCWLTLTKVVFLFGSLSRDQKDRLTPYMGGTGYKPPPINFLPPLIDFYTH